MTDANIAAAVDLYDEAARVAESVMIVCARTAVAAERNGLPVTRMIHLALELATVRNEVESATARIDRWVEEYKDDPNPAIIGAIASESAHLRRRTLVGDELLERHD